MREFTIVADVGGTFTKVMIVDNLTKEMFGEIKEYPSMSNEDKDVIINNFVNMINKSVYRIKENTGYVRGIILAFPGPFDYKNGISLIDGVEKFKSLFGVNIKEEISKKLDYEYIPILDRDKFDIIFENDARLFALGEAILQKLDEKVLYITIGTGTGSTYMIGNNILTNFKDATSNEGYIYSYKFKDGIINDYISKIGLQNLAKNYEFSENQDIKELFNLGEKGDERAKIIFCEFGKILGEMLLEVWEKNSFDVVVIGGQISKSKGLFEKSLKECVGLKNKITIKYSENTSYSVLIGAISLF